MSWNEVTYHFCPVCGGELDKRILKKGEPKRLICKKCGFIFYLDPKVATIVLIPKDEKVLLLKRAISPGKGLWVMPGGFVDRFERVEDAAIREVKEEVGLDVEITSLLGVYSYLGQAVVIIAYLGRIIGGIPKAADETLEVKFFPFSKIPWAKLAFPSTRDALTDYINQQKSNKEL